MTQKSYSFELSLTEYNYRKSAFTFRQVSIFLSGWTYLELYKTSYISMEAFIWVSFYPFHLEKNRSKLVFNILVLFSLQLIFYLFL